MYEETNQETIVYKCRVCGKEHAISGSYMTEIAQRFIDLGWGNHAVDRGARVDYIVLCKEHNTADRVALMREYGNG